MATVAKTQNHNRPWRVRFQTEGKQHERSFAKEPEARRFAKTADTARITPHIETFRDYAERWMTQTGPGKSVGTLRSYEKDLRLHLYPALGGMPLSAITREKCKDLLLSLTPCVAKNVKCLLGAILNEAVRDKRIPENPAKGIVVPYSNKRAELVPVTYDQLCTIEQSIPAEHRLVIWLMLGCGLRIGEAMAVRADSVRGNGKTLRVEEQVALDHHKSVLAHLKCRKDGDYRDVPLPTWLLVKINAHVAEFGTDGYLFPSYAVDGFQTQRWRSRFDQGCIEAKCQTLYPHNLRHRYASTMLNAGEPIANVSKWLGHRDINLTVNLYGHLMPEATDRAVSAADKAMAEFSAA